MHPEEVSSVWLNRRYYEDAEIAHYENLTKSNVDSIDTGAIKFMEKKIVEYEKTITSLVTQLKALELRVAALEKTDSQTKPVHQINIQSVPSAKPAVNDDDDDDVDLFGSDSDEDDEAAAKVREDRLKAYEAKKSKKPVLIAKSNVILDVKPWDDETDMKLMEQHVRKVEADGLLWGAAKLVPLAYGIHKLQISCVVEDDKVSIDWLTEQLLEIEDFIQSVDIAAFNKI
ncbi:probable elongation factor 1-delta isoform X2 [Diabrotica virgifera virgifera]|uniref:Elongation factor 1-delta n=1 Tax=Diabrotica virgifera virgifera TaxID=50390 RepID=A0ABM5LB13_DIAVI|nr:probable elongation factor 1-delta isoform X2 [Diabrotica virgifera virgifera]XP_050519628.1 probable elongation factor 1-delta isoform X2 [Diabrotica virgifera virgifera]